MSRITFEVCVDTYDGAVIAANSGADRIELCSSLAEGGLTPSIGLMTACAKLPVPVNAMIRPRAGGFHFSADELAIMCADAKAAESVGMAGIVTGATTPAGEVDLPFLEALLAATALPATLHRAIDTVADPVAAIETAVALGFERILTSGGEASAAAGSETIGKMVQAAAGRISVMAGSGITCDNVREILTRTGVREIHASCASVQPTRHTNAAELRLGFVAEKGVRATSAESISQLRALLATYQEAAE